MRVWFLPTGATVLVDILAWFVIHMGISWLATRLPDRWFTSAGLSTGKARCELAVYERVFFIRRWKHHLPDAAPWFRGFPKKSLRERSEDYLRRFEAETRRGEAAHWMTIAMAPLFFLWNSPGVGWGMIVYAVFANLPCILVQRFNRGRLQRLG